MRIEQGRPLIEPDRRYWRRRANRHVRQARHTRTVVRWAVLILVNLGIAALLLFTAIRAAQHVTSTREFALETIEVFGTSKTSPAAVRAQLRPFVGRNILNLDLDDVRARACADPWVARASAKLILPHTLRIRVEERAPAALALIRGIVHVLDREGFVIGPCGPGLFYDMPILTGLERLEGEALAAALARGADAIARIREAAGAWEDGISEVDLSQPDRIGIVTKKNGPKVLLDPGRVERNLRDYLALRPEIERCVGPAEYVDLRWSHRITVLPAQRDSLSESE